MSKPRGLKPPDNDAEALRRHALYRGKIQTVAKCPIRGFDDFSVWYSPGVAAPCRAIQAQPDAAYLYTNKGNSIAIVSDGSRVLGLGDIGPAAGLPVMEGKALLFKHLGGVDAVPLCLSASDPDRFVEIVRALGTVSRLSAGSQIRSRGPSLNSNSCQSGRPERIRDYQLASQGGV